MIKDNTNIDNLFRDRFGGFEPEVPAYLWDNIEASLDKRRRKIVWIYLRSVAAVAAIVFAFLTGYLFTENTTNTLYSDLTINNDKKINQLHKSAYVITDFSKNNSTTEIANKNPENKQIKKHTIIAKSADRNLNTQANSTKELAIENSLSVEKEENIISDIQLAEVSFDSDFQVNTNNLFVENEVNEQLANNEDENEKRELELRKLLLETQIPFDKVFDDEVIADNSDLKRWTVAGLFSPMYNFRNTISSNEMTNETQNYDLRVSEINQSNENATLTYSGGLNFSFNASKRFSIQSGIYYSKSGINTSGVWAYDNPNDFSKAYNVSTSSGRIVTNPKFFAINDIISSPTDPASGEISINAENAELLQNFEYIEIPLVSRYKLVDQKLGVNLLGGITTGLLVGNTAYLEDDEESFYLGETQNVNQFNYSALVGVGFEYAFNKQISLNMEPTFKYSLNPINNETLVKTHPYSFGVFTGISYRF